MRDRPRIFSTHTLHPRAIAILADAGELLVASALDPETLIREASDADIVIVRAPLPPALFPAATGLRAAMISLAASRICLPCGLVTGRYPGSDSSVGQRNVVCAWRADFATSTSTGPGRPVEAMWKASAMARGISAGSVTR